MSETKQQEDGPMEAVRGALAALSNLSGEVDVSSSGSGAPPLRVSVLSGFLGAGKTTVLQHILHNSDGLRIAIIVNDMADVNIDANMLVSSVETEEKMVALSNGCICCTLREDLFINLSKLAVRGDLDYVIIESSGISEPMPVAETFTFRDGRGTSLGDVAALDTMITVVDGASFLQELHDMDTLEDRGWEATTEDTRTVAQLFCDQLEFANVIVLNKIDLMDDEGRERLSATLRQFNPSAHIISSAWGRVNPERLLGTNLFDMEQAEAHPGWLQEAREGEHKPETEEYGISSITFRSRRPFNMQRFDELKAAMEKSHLLRQANDPKEKENREEKEECDGFSDQMLLSKAHHSAARCIIRSKGLVWLANRQSHWQEAVASLAGRRFTVSYRAPWSAAINGSGEQPHQMENADIWQEPYGDRRTELVIIGQDMNHEAILSAFEACVLTDQEMSIYEKLFLDSKPLDVIDDWAAGNKDAVVERLKRFEIEILAPRRKKTQVLQAAPVSTTPVSAHCCIAVFQGGSRFQIKKYLRYAHLMSELSSGLVKEFVLPNAMDAQTTFLADQTSDGTALSDMLAYLEEGDKVQLEWLHIRVEIETEEDQDRYSIVEQCLKLNKLDEQTEMSLLREYPKPQIMIPKQDENKEVTSCKVDEQMESDVGRKEKKARKGKKGKKRSNRRR